MAKNKVFIWALCIGALIFSGCRQDDDDDEALTRAMVNFDQAFVPVLYYSMQGDANRAKHAALYLAFEWQKMDMRYRHRYEDDKTWQDGFDRIDAWLGDALYEIDNNCAVVGANLLEHARYEWTELRKSREIAYYPDYLYDAQAASSWLRQVLSDKRACQTEWEAIAQQIALLNTSCWQAVNESPDPGLYKLDEAELAYLQQQKDRISHYLAQLNESVSCAQADKMVAACQGLSPAIWEAIGVFGNFEATKTYFAER
jgi:hypothetical protein